MNLGRATLCSRKDVLSLALAGHSCSDSVIITIPCKVYTLLQRLLMQPKDYLTQQNSYDIENT